MPAEAHEVFATLLEGHRRRRVAHRHKARPRPRRDARLLRAFPTTPASSRGWRGALALVGANVVDARTYTTKDGYATAVFWIQDAEEGPYEAERLPRLRAMIDRTLKGEVKPAEAFGQRDKLKKRERAFQVPTSITFDNDGSDIYTIVEVDTRDRPGLLYDSSARTLSEDRSVRISSAVIATYGEQVVDSFYVKDSFGLKLARRGTTTDPSRSGFATWRIRYRGSGKNRGPMRS